MHSGNAVVAKGKHWISVGGFWNNPKMFYPPDVSFWEGVIGVLKKSLVHKNKTGGLDKNLIFNIIKILSLADSNELLW